MPFSNLSRFIAFCSSLSRRSSFVLSVVLAFAQHFHELAASCFCLCLRSVNAFKALPLRGTSTRVSLRLLGLNAVPLNKHKANKGMNRNKLQAFVGTGGFRSSCSLVSLACN